MLISYIQCSTLPVSCQLKVSFWVVQQDDLVLSLSASCSFLFSFSGDILGWGAFIQGFHFSLEACDWLSRPSSSVPRCCEMELLSRLLKIFLSLPCTTPGVRSLQMAESSQKPLENYGVAQVVWGWAGGAYINMKNSFFFTFFWIEYIWETFF